MTVQRHLQNNEVKKWLRSILEAQPEGIIETNEELSEVSGYSIENIQEAFLEMLKTEEIIRYREYGVRVIESKRKESKQRKESNTSITFKDLKVSTSLLRKDIATFLWFSRSAKLTYKTKKEFINDVIRIIDFWNNKGLNPCYKRNTKTFKITLDRIASLLTGELLDQKYNIKDVEQSIDNLSLAVKNSGYEPVNGTNFHSFLKGVYLKDFIYNQFSVKNPFLFLRFLKNKPKRVGPLKDTHPEHTAHLRNFYIKKTLGNITPEESYKEFKNKTNEYFIISAERVLDFFEKNKSKMDLTMMEVMSERDYIRIFCEALEYNWQDKWDKVTPYWFQSDITFNHILPSYLYKEGVIEESYDGLDT